MNNNLLSPEQIKLLNESKEQFTVIENLIREKQAQIKAEKIPEQYKKEMDGTGYEYLPFNAAIAIRDERFPIHRDEWYGQGIIMLGSEWIIAMVTSHVNVNGVWQSAPGVEAKRVTFKKDMPHTIENVIDIGNDVKSALSGALVKAWANNGVFPDIYNQILRPVPTDAQNERFKKLLELCSPGAQEKLKEKWKTQYADTADAFLDLIEQKLKAKETSDTPTGTNNSGQ